MVGQSFGLPALKMKKNCLGLHIKMYNTMYINKLYVFIFFIIFGVVLLVVQGPIWPMVHRLYMPVIEFFGNNVCMHICIYL